MNDTTGFLRLITETKEGALIGAQIVGPGASDLISGLSLAIENGLTSKDISLTIHLTQHLVKRLWIQLNWLMAYQFTFNKIKNH
mgnify:CR=1 FL=1